MASPMIINKSRPIISTRWIVRWAENELVMVTPREAVLLRTSYEYQPTSHISKHPIKEHLFYFIAIFITVSSIASLLSSSCFWALRWVILQTLFLLSLTASFAISPTFPAFLYRPLPAFVLPLFLSHRTSHDDTPFVTAASIGSQL